MACLICRCDLATTQPHSKSHEDKLAQKSIISKHLHIIFILKHIFELPSHQLSLYLRNCPNVEQWITICDTCEELIDGCKSVYQDLLDVNRKFRATKQRIVNIVKEGCDENGRRGSKCAQSEEEEDYDELDIMDGCRRFISKHDYSALSDPFVEGDSKALEYVNQTESKTEVVEESDPYYDDDCDEDVDWGCNNDADNITEEVDTLPGTDHKLNRKSSRHKSKGVGRIKKSDDDDDWKPGLKCTFKKTGNPRVKKTRRDYAHSLTRVKCPTCGKMVQNKDKLALHNRKVHDDNTDVKEAPDIPKKTRKKYTFKSGKERVKKTWRDYSYSYQYTRVKCLTCGKMVQNKYKLETHNRQVHGSHQCDFCPNNFSSMQKLFIHRNRIHSKPCKFSRRKGRVTCPEPNCNSTVISVKDLELHFQMAHKEAPLLKCFECEKRFYTRSGITAHRKEHSRSKKEKNITCERCGSTFWSTSALTVHQKNALRCKLLYQTEDQATTVCEQCGKRLAGEYSLKSHIKIVHNEELEQKKEKFRCDNCGTKFKKKSHWQLHLFEEHQITTGKSGSKKGFYKCPEEGCDRVYRENKRLQYHLTQHSGQPQCRCEECGKMFYFPDNLNAHKLTVHNQDGKFKCEVCGKELSSLIYLKRHMGRHNANKIEDSADDKMGEQQ